MISAWGNGVPPVARGMMIRSIRPLIGRQYMLGHGEIDSDHVTIADWWHRAIRCEPVEFPFFLARLKKLMRGHFDHEAALLREAGGRMCECHREEHRLLLALCDQAGALSHHHWKKAQSLLRTDFPKLVREHIISMDQFAVLFLATRRGQ